MGTHLGAEGPDRRYLGRRGVLGNEHLPPDTESAETVGYGGAVVAGGGGYHPGGALPIAEAQQLVEGSPDLEGAGELEVLAT